MKQLATYIKQKWCVLAVFLLFFLIFWLSFTLYHLPVEAVVYPMLLCLVLGCGFLIGGYLRARKRHALLCRIRTMADAGEAEFPSADTAAEADYRQIIRLLCEEQRAYRTEQSRRNADMIDYYTVWAHQIKTPIASMRLHLQNEDSALSRALSADLFRVEQYAEMVLTFLRLDSASTDYVFREYDLDAIVRQAVKKFAGEFIRRKLTLVYEPLHDTVITDEKWLSFVIEQVLSNALKYTKSGTITITEEPEKRLCIRDTGIGIAPEDLPRIFENGFTGYNGRADRRASGIGLYLCRRICTRLGHTITAASVVDVGTTITIDLFKYRSKT